MAPNKTERVRQVRVIKRPSRENEASVSSALLAVISLVAVLLALAYTLAPHVYAQVTRSQTSPITVWDNVLAQDTVQALHKVCSAFDREDNVLFHWPIPESHRPNPIEQAIGHILHQLHDAQTDSFVVEYWVRQKWYHTLAHADLDEEWLLQQEHNPNPLPNRHPIYGHVLYLPRGTNVNGPTVVFPNVANGGSLIEQPNKDIELLIVPNVPGRLLRFEGHLLHAVPRPSTLWLYPVSDDYPHEPEEVYGRSVLLFNLWPTDSPPLGKAFEKSVEETEKDSQSKLSCQDRREWKLQSITNEFKGTLWQKFWLVKQIFQLPLMGFEQRRGTKDLTLILKATSLVEDAFRSNDPTPKRVYLSQRTMSVESLLKLGRDDEF